MYISYHRAIKNENGFISFLYAKLCMYDQYYYFRPTAMSQLAKNVFARGRDRSIFSSFTNTKHNRYETDTTRTIAPLRNRMQA
jgi:hypothetical protein